MVFYGPLAQLVRASDSSALDFMVQVCYGNINIQKGVKISKATVRIVNEYRVILLPGHSKCMHNNWKDYVYEHIVVAEQRLGRPLLDNEVVHHLDGNRVNNHHANLLVLNRAQHAKLHRWLEAGAPHKQLCGENGLNSVNAKVVTPKYCIICNRMLQDKQKNCCSNTCFYKHRRKIVDRPSFDQLTVDLKSMSMVAVGKKYGVSDNAIRKWIKQYNTTMLTPSQASDKSLEGVETTGAVNMLNNQQE